MDVAKKNNWLQFDPLRPADWRWQRATQLLQQGHRPQGWDDAATRLAFAYQRAAASATRPDRPRAIPRRFASLAAAHGLYEAGDAVGDELEARLLTATPVERIAEQTQLSAEVITSYESIFFDVTRAVGRGATDWLMEEAVGFGRPGRWEPSEGQVWKWSALAGGEWLVDLLVSDHLGRPQPDYPDRHLLAEKARWLVREHVAFMQGDRRRWTELLDEGCRLFAESLARQCRQGDRMLAVHVHFLRGISGLPPMPELDSGAAAATERGHAATVSSSKTTECAL